jgi:hypothetical protein
MGNHVHLYPRTPQPNLSAGMHDWNYQAAVDQVARAALWA